MSLTAPDIETRGSGGEITTVLFDLDGTLLDVDVKAFFPAYFGALASRVSSYIDPGEFLPRLMTATQAMIADRDPALTNQEVFMAHFFDGLEVSRDELLPVFEAFYREEFPALGRYARPVEGARDVVLAVIGSGRRAAVATSPVFPEAAIMERLRWAGLDDVPFAFVTHYANMHSCKPHPEYYTEILLHLGCRAEETLMVGNDVEEDLVAQEVGLKVFLVESNVIHRGERPCNPDYRGPITELAAILGLEVPALEGGSRAAGPSS